MTAPRTLAAEPVRASRPGRDGETGGVCAVVVTWNPETDLTALLEQTAPQVEAMVIVENGSAAPARARVREAAGRWGAALIENGGNLGVAAALNQGVGWAAERGYRWALLLDQDSVPAGGMVAELLRAAGESSGGGRVAVVGANYRSTAGGAPLPPLRPVEAGVKGAWEPARTVITSGSLLALDAFAAIGPFREEFFVDCVDIEYCLRARRRGYAVRLARRALLDHSIGRVSRHRLGWKRTGTSNHSPERRYFMARNHAALLREYALREPHWALRSVYSRLASLALIALFETDKGAKLRASAAGFFDGLRGRLGRGGWGGQAGESLPKG